MLSDRKKINFKKLPLFGFGRGDSDFRINRKKALKKIRNFVVKHKVHPEEVSSMMSEIDSGDDAFGILYDGHSKKITKKASDLYLDIY